jgi:hypothetical protein
VRQVDGGAWAGGTGAFIFDSNVVPVPGNGCPLSWQSIQPSHLSVR